MWVWRSPGHLGPPRLTQWPFPPSLTVWPLKRPFSYIHMDKPAPREEGGLSEAAFEQWLEAQSLGLWPENEGYEDAPPSEE